MCFLCYVAAAEPFEKHQVVVLPPRLLSVTNPIVAELTIPDCVYTSSVNRVCIMTAKVCVLASCVCLSPYLCLCWCGVTHTVVVCAGHCVAGAQVTMEKGETGRYLLYPRQPVLHINGHLIDIKVVSWALLVGLLPCLPAPCTIVMSSCGRVRS